MVELYSSNLLHSICWDWPFFTNLTFHKDID